MPVFAHGYGPAEGGFRIEVHDADMRFVEDIVEVRVVGPKGMRRIERKGIGEQGSASRPDLSETDKARLDWNVRWLGEAGQKALADTHVGVVGVGGVGTELVKVCRGLGVNKYTLIDMDKVELANLNRLIRARRMSASSRSGSQRSLSWQQSRARRSRP